MWALGRHAKARFNAADGIACDRLQLSDLHPHKDLLSALSGIPVTADACAYEPIQRLLAVGTSDGRIKIFGREGVERVLLSTRGARATRQLQFLFNRGVLLRLCRVSAALVISRRRWRTSRATTRRAAWRIGSTPAEGTAECTWRW